MQSLPTPTELDLIRVRKILEFQFNLEFASIFLEPEKKIKIVYSKKTRKIKYIYFNNRLQASYRSNLGNFTLTLDAGLRVLSQIEFPLFRVIVNNEVLSFIKDGKSVFTKHIINYDPYLKIGDEVFIVSEDDELLAIGKMTIPSNYINDFQTGSAVNVRKGIKSLKNVK